MPKLDNYKDKVAIVTGASSGIGAEMGRQLAQRGAKVALVARRSARLEELAAEIEKKGGQCSVHACDVAVRTQVETTFKAVLDRWGKIDILVNNAGIGAHGLFEDIEIEKIEEMIQTNYLGSVYWMKLAIDHMKQRRSGWMLNVSSMAGLMAQADEAAYSASKFALSALSKALGWELKRHNIHVMAVHPAMVRTEMTSEESLNRLPNAARTSMIECDEFVADTLRGLEDGETSLVVPRKFGPVARLYAMSPNLIGGAIARIKMKAVPELS